VVRNIHAIEIAFSIADRVTFLGSTIHALIISLNSSVDASYQKLTSTLFLISSTTIAHSFPAFSAICFKGYASALATI
jgi:hypothetical protein